MADAQEGGDLVKIKALAAILLIALAAATTSFVLKTAETQGTAQNIGFSKSYTIVQIGDNETGIGTDGIAIDSPGMPG
jgi:hypothetical protein